MMFGGFLVADIVEAHLDFTGDGCERLEEQPGQLVVLFVEPFSGEQFDVDIFLEYLECTSQGLFCFIIEQFFLRYVRHMDE